MALSNRHQKLIQVLSLAVVVGSLSYMATQSLVRSDVTAEGLSRITPETQALLETVAKERPVVVTAYVSKDVPRQYVGHRRRLLNLLREMEARGGNGLTVRLYEPDLHSDEAQEAADNYGIVPRSLLNQQAGRIAGMDVFLGVAFTSGPREEVIPFIDRGLSVEYELARALRTVVQNKKRVVGILRNDVRMMGHFDLQSRSRQPPWQIVEELKKQYEVRSLNPGTDVPKDVDVLVVPQVSSLSQPQIDKVRDYVEAGRAALVVADPMPAFNVKLAPPEPMLPPPGGGGGGGFMGGGGGRPADPKGDYGALMKTLGVEWPDQRVVFDAENPNPRFGQTPKQIVFLTRSGEGEGFSPKSPIVDGLAQVVGIYAGEVKKADGAKVTFEPLLATGKNSGYHGFEDMVSRANFLFGLQGPFPPRKPGVASRSNHVLAARVTNAGEGEDEKGKRNAIVLADLDMFSNTFFAYHERGGDIDGDGLIDIRFDNVTFLLNCIDTLAGDERFIDLRKRQPVFRRLDLVDDMTKTARAQREENLRAANLEAENQVKAAQSSLDAKVEAIRARTGLDDTTKAIMARQVQEAESRRLQVKQEKIERDKERKVRQIQKEHLRETDEVQNKIRVLSIILPPIPAFLMGLYIFSRKRRRESSVIPASRKRA